MFVWGKLLSSALNMGNIFYYPLRHLQMQQLNCTGTESHVLPLCMAFIPRHSCFYPREEALEPCTHPLCSKHTEKALNSWRSAPPGWQLLSTLGCSSRQLCIPYFTRKTSKSIKPKNLGTFTPYWRASKQITLPRKQSFSNLGGILV